MISPFYRFFPLLGVMIALFCVACNPFDDVSKATLPTYTPEIAVPLFNTSLNLKDIVASSGDTLGKLLVDVDGTMTYTYTGDTIQQTSSDLLKTLESAFIPVPLADTVQTLNIGQLAFNGFSIVNGVIKQGTLRMNFLYNLRESINGNLVFENFKKDGKSLTIPIKANFPADAGSFIALPPQLLAGYKLQTNKGLITIRYTAITASGAKVRLNSFFGNVSGLSFSYLEATTGDVPLAIPPGVVPVELYKNASGSVNFTNPRIRLWVQNSFGFPVRIKSDAITALTKDGRTLTLVSKLLEKGIDVPYPKNNEVGKIMTQSFVFDTSNSNIAEIIAAQPIEFRYNASILPNADKIPNLIGHVTDASFLKASVTIELPLNAATAGFEGDRAVRLDATDGKNITEAEFKLVTVNEMPIAISTQVYFTTDSRGVYKIDSLFQKGKTLVIEAASPSNALSTKETITFIPVSGERMSRIRSAPYAIIRTKLVTFNNGVAPVSIYARQKVNVRMGAKFKIKN
jgi:hypothetical protein